MAKMNGDFTFTGRLGNVTAYKMKGVEEVILRTKGGASKEKIKKSPSCAGILRNATEFGGPSKAAKGIRFAVYPAQLVSDQNLAAAFTRLGKAMQLKDTTGPKGERNVLLSQYGSLLQGFNLNKRVALENITGSSLFYNLSRDTVSASVQLPALLPGINFNVPGTFGLFRWVAVLGVASDVFYHPSGYQPASSQPIYPVGDYTEWMPTTVPCQEQHIGLTVTGSPVLSSTDVLVLCAGIQFGIPGPNNEVRPIPHIGAAKILALA